MFAVLVVPQLRGDPEFFTAKASAQQLLEGQPDLRLIAVNRRAVEVPIADACSVAHGFSDGFGRDMVGTEGSETDCGHFRT